MGWLTSLGLCAAGLLAIIVEFFVPAAGIIGVVGIGSIVAGVVLAYTGYGITVGSIFLAGVVISTPLVIALYFKIFPRSFVGRWLILRSEQKREEGFASFTPDLYRSLRGKRGRSLTTLRPSGIALIEGSKHSVVTGGEFIEKDVEIQVEGVQGSRIVVKKGV